MINLFCAVFDHANESWSNAKSNVLDGGGDSKGCSNGVGLDHVWDGAPDTGSIDAVADTCEY